MLVEDANCVIAEARLQVRQLAVGRGVGAQLEDLAGILRMRDARDVPRAGGKSDSEQGGG